MLKIALILLLFASCRPPGPAPLPAGRHAGLPVVAAPAAEAAAGEWQLWLGRRLAGGAAASAVRALNRLLRAYAEVPRPATGPWGAQVTA
jgi:hypothetical protein